MSGKPIEVVRPTAVDFVGIAQNGTGIVLVEFKLPGRVDVSIELTPEVLASLEAKLAAVRAEQASQQRGQ